ncbi:MAG: hypothetical protein OXI26_09580 [bacterium]|nr:hypothetical protein [bacterium]
MFDLPVAAPEATGLPKARASPFSSPLANTVTGYVHTVGMAEATLSAPVNVQWPFTVANSEDAAMATAGDPVGTNLVRLRTKTPLSRSSTPTTPSGSSPTLARDC